MRNNTYSNLKIANHPEKLRSFQEGRITAPIYVRVKPINLCNHACSWCVYKADRKPETRSQSPAAMPPIHSDMHTDMKERDMIPHRKMLEVLRDFKTMGVKAVTYSGGGEPLLHRDIVEFMQTTLNFGLDLSIITNGQLLNHGRAAVLAYAKWVRVSMDYTTPAQMAHSRLVHERMFPEVMENLQTFARLKQPDCNLGVNFIVHRENCDGLVAFAKELFDRGVENIRFSPMWTPDFVAYHTPIRDRVLAQLREIAEMEDRGDVNSTYDLHNPAHSPQRAYNRCYIMQTVPVVGADQKVYACHNKAYDETGCIGSIAEHSFKELWFSDAARAKFETLNPQCDCRHQCSNDAKNHVINGLLEASPDNFV